MPFFFLSFLLSLLTSLLHCSSCLSSKTTDPRSSLSLRASFHFICPLLDGGRPRPLSLSLSLQFFYFSLSLSFPSIRDCTFSARLNLDDPHSAILSTLPSSLLFTFTTLHESNTREEARNRALSRRARINRVTDCCYCGGHGSFFSYVFVSRPMMNRMMFRIKWF